MSTTRGSSHRDRGSRGDMEREKTHPVWVLRLPGQPARSRKSTGARTGSRHRVLYRTPQCTKTLFIKNTHHHACFLDDIGIRMRFNRTLVETALAVGAILGERFPDCVVGTDTRTTSPLLARPIIAGIMGAGGHARFTGIAPTPSVAYSARTVKAGCMITASIIPRIQTD